MKYVKPDMGIVELALEYVDTVEGSVPASTDNVPDTSVDDDLWGDGI